MMNKKKDKIATENFELYSRIYTQMGIMGYDKEEISECAEIADEIASKYLKKTKPAILAGACHIILQNMTKN